MSLTPIFLPDGRYVRGAFYRLMWHFSPLEGEWIGELKQFMSEEPEAIVVPPLVTGDNGNIVRVRGANGDFLLDPPCPQCHGQFSPRPKPPRVPARPRSAIITLEGCVPGKIASCDDRLNPIVPEYPWGYWHGSGMFLRHEVAVEILDAGFTGAELLQATIWWDHDPYTRFTGVSALVDTSNGYPDLIGVCKDPEDNRCPYCGQQPLWCDRCGDGQSGLTCWRCGKRIFYRWYDRPAFSRRGFLIQLPRKGDGSDPIDVRKWCGQDILRWYGDVPVVTRRLVMWMKQRRYGPLVALPIDAYVEGISPEQEEHLQRALGRSGCPESE